jgi:hypothetical protein
MPEFETPKCTHDMPEFETPNANYGCDGCEKGMPKGATMKGCRICDYDLCIECSD